VNRTGNVEQLSGSFAKEEDDDDVEEVEETLEFFNILF
jgi:hypothetical protein